MKVVLVNAHDQTGGAAKAAYRLHLGLRRQGIPSRMLVQTKVGNDESVTTTFDRFQAIRSIVAGYLDILPLRLCYPSPSTFWSTGWLNTGPIMKKLNLESPDLVHLHWIGGGCLPIAALSQFEFPIVWTLHDAWPFTGGCHFPMDCVKYEKSCGKCPQLNSRYQYDLSRFIFSRKRKKWKDVKINIVAPSRWLAQCARSSALLGSNAIYVIPYGLDTQIFRPIDRRVARSVLGLPPDRKIVATGAYNITRDPRKGFPLFLSALKSLHSKGGAADIQVVVFGAPAPEEPLDTGFKTSYLGYLHEEITLALVYSSADVFVASSVQENLPNTVLEAMACGTPCVAFNVGGMPDLIEPGRTGYLAQAFDAQDLAHGIEWLLNDDDRRLEISKHCRQKVLTDFELSKTVGRYIHLYSRILERITSASPEEASNAGQTLK